MSTLIAAESPPLSDAAFRDALRQAVERSRGLRYADALDALGRLLEAAEREGSKDRQARVLLERGVTFLHQGSYEDARADFEASAGLYDALGDVVRKSRARLRLVSMTTHGDPAAAERDLDEIEADLREAGDEPTLRYAQLYRARIRIQQGDHEGALEILGPLREYYAGPRRRARRVDVLNLESYALQELGRLEQARAGYRELIDAAFDEGNQRMLAYAYCNLGDVERDLGKPQVAAENLDRAIEMLDRLRAEIPGGAEERMTYLDAQVSAYDGKIQLLVDGDDARGALEVAERFHAKSLLEELRSPGTPLDREELGDEAREILGPMLELQRRLIREGLTDAERLSLQEFERRWASASRAARRSRREELPEIVPRPIADVQKRLPAATAMLVYWAHPERLMLWVVLAERIELVQIPLGREALRESVERFLVPIRDRVRAEDLALRDGGRAHLELGAELYRSLIEPARPVLKGVEQLIVVPDDQLWHLPFEALVREIPDEPSDAAGVWFSEYARARYLLEEFSVLYAPSATVWAELAGRGSAGKGVVTVAPSLEGSDAARERGWSLAPLPGAVVEATKVASLIEPGRALLGREATERAVKRDLRQYRYLHFATHGYLHDERPQLSGLFLWPDAETETARALEDGLFQGFEVRGLPLQAELVSLAACNSGLGQLSRAEGIVGTARAFLVAGSKNVLVSLWPVDDRASGRLVESFYGELSKANPLADALRRSKMNLMTETVTQTMVAGEERVSYAHPYFWAAYVLIGGDARELP